MITDQVIKEIYKQYNRPPKDRGELELPYYLGMLENVHQIENDDMEVVVKDMEEFNPFRRFLIRSLHAILDLDTFIAFVFQNHILFFDKKTPNVHVNIKPAPKKSFFGRLFGK